LLGVTDIIRLRFGEEPQTEYHFKYGNAQATERIPMKSGVQHPPHGSSIGPVFDAVVVGASAGGFLSLLELLRPFHPGFPFAVLVVMHLDPHRESIMSELLSRATDLTVKQALDGARIETGVVYLGPPNRHLTIQNGKVALCDTPLVNMVRPAVDVLFHSAAAEYKEHCIAVVLSGALSDGSRGLREVKSAGGTTMVEDPVSAHFKGMPQSAVATGCVDFVLPANEIGAKLLQLCTVHQ
jgi:two-component system chemotaxis response regulator CheB